MAFTRVWDNSSTLDVVNSDGTGQRTIAERKQPWGFQMSTPPSWSPDAKLIAVPAGYTPEDNASAIFCYPVDGGKPIIFPSRQTIIQVAWLPDQTGLLFLMAPSAGFASIFTKEQLREQPFPKGTPQRVTNDLNNYRGISLTADGKLLTSVERNLSSTVFVGPSFDPDHGAPITTSKSDGLSLAWMPNGKLLLQDAKFQLPESDADGGNRVPLFQAPMQSFQFSVCGNGQFIVYGVQEKNSFQIWRVDATGRNQKRLTKEGVNWEPHCSPDGASVVYDSLVNGKGRLMTISTQGGSGVSLADGSFSGARYSPDGKQIASYEESHEQEKIVIVSATGGAPLKRFDVALGGSLDYWEYSMLRWTPDGRALTHPLLQGNEMNLWKQPVSGGPPKQITHFHDHIAAYDWSPDGKRLAITRYHYSSDAVLIGNFH
jgi:Tol biopolymer transport system component